MIQGDADTDLVHYPDLAFDYAILSQTIQATYNPRLVLEQLLRIGKRVVVSFPNFGNWRVRTQLMFGGKMPKTDNGHDSFLLHEPELFDTIRGFLSAGALKRGIVGTEGWLP